MKALLDDDELVDGLVELLRAAPLGLTYRELWCEFAHCSYAFTTRVRELRWLKVVQRERAVTGQAPLSLSQIETFRVGAPSSTKFTQRRLRKLLDRARDAGIVAVDVDEVGSARYRLKIYESDRATEPAPCEHDLNPLTGACSRCGGRIFVPRSSP